MEQTHGEQLVINEEPERFELVLDDVAGKFGMNRSNVRDILKYVVMNEDVLKMVKNTILSEEGVNLTQIQGAEATFEPIMTRSKLRRVSQRQTNQVLPPSFRIDSSKTNKLEDFLSWLDEEDDEEDEEYHPENESELESDDDASDFRSTCTDSPCILSTPVKQVVDLGEGLVQRRGEDSARKGESVIAKRTRSKLPLTEVSIDALEQQFLPTDVTADLFDQRADEDEEWQKFITGLLQTSTSAQLNETEGDDEDDPEYNFMEDDPNPDDIQYNLKISQKEFSELIDDYFKSGKSPCVTSTVMLVSEETNMTGDRDEESRSPSALGEESDAHTLWKSNKTVKEILTEKRKQGITVASTEALPDVSSPVPKRLKVDDSVYRINNEERIQLCDQMRKHVQLLSQTFLLTSFPIDGKCPFQKDNELVAQLIDELELLKTHSPAGSLSAFNTVNLELAVKTVHDAPFKAIPDEPDFRPPRERKLPYSAMEFLATSPLFCDLTLLPSVIYDLEARKCRTEFLPSEDRLIALGYLQFRHLDNYAEFIHKHLLPSKTPQQIAHRIKNQRRPRDGESNPIQDLVQSEFKYPIDGGQRQLVMFDAERDYRAPILQLGNVLPSWVEDMLLIRVGREKNLSRKDLLALASQTGCKKPPPSNPSHANASPPAGKVPIAPLAPVAIAPVVSAPSTRVPIQPKSTKEQRNASTVPSPNSTSEGTKTPCVQQNGTERTPPGEDSSKRIKCVSIVATGASGLRGFQLAETNRVRHLNEQLRAGHTGSPQSKRKLAPKIAQLDGPMMSDDDYSSSSLDGAMFATPSPPPEALKTPTKFRSIFPRPYSLPAFYTSPQKMVAYKLSAKAKRLPRGRPSRSKAAVQKPFNLLPKPMPLTLQGVLELQAAASGKKEPECFVVAADSSEPSLCIQAAFEELRKRERESKQRQAVNTAPLVKDPEELQMNSMTPTRPRSLQKKEREEEIINSTIEMLQMDRDKELDVVSSLTSFLTQLRDTLTTERYTGLLRVLANEQLSSDEVIDEAVTILRAWPHFVRVFATLLPCSLAREHDLFAEHMLGKKAVDFILRLKVRFQNRPNHLKRVLKRISNWNGTVTDFIQKIRPMFRGHPFLLEEFNSLFIHNPLNYTFNEEDFEEMTVEQLMKLDDEDSSFEMLEFRELSAAQEKASGGKLVKCPAAVPGKPKLSAAEDAPAEQEKPAPENRRTRLNSSSKDKKVLLKTVTSRDSDSPQPSVRALSAAEDGLHVWSKEEDRLLLTECKKNGASPLVIQRVAEALHLTTHQVRTRLETLISFCFDSSRSESDTEC